MFLVDGYLENFRTVNDWEIYLYLAVTNFALGAILFSVIHRLWRLWRGGSVRLSK